MSRRGFTLMEMMVVLAIIGIMAAMAFTSGRGLLEVARVQSAANAAMQAVRDTRIRAISSRCSQVLVFSPPTDGGTLTVPVGFPRKAGMLVGYSKGMCGPLSTSNAGPWEYAVGLDGGIGQGTDHAPLMEWLGEFGTTITVNGGAVGGTVGQAIAFDQQGRVVGTFTVNDVLAASAFSQIADGASFQMTFTRTVGGTSNMRSVTVRSTGDVMYGLPDGGP